MGSCGYGIRLGLCAPRGERCGVVVGYLFSIGRIAFRIPWKSLAGYIGASALMVSVMYPLHAFIPPSNTAILQFVRVGALLVVGLTTYLGTGTRSR
jgi:hypothetical protein